MDRLVVAIAATIFLYVTIKHKLHRQECGWTGQIKQDGIRACL